MNFYDLINEVRIMIDKDLVDLTKVVGDKALAEKIKEYLIKSGLSAHSNSITTGNGGNLTLPVKTEEDVKSIRNIFPENRVDYKPGSNMVQIVLNKEKNNV